MNVALILLAFVAAEPARVTEPLESPANWVTAADYPAAAYRAGMQGTTTVRIEIAPTGIITDCSPSESSGSVLLDVTACGLVRMKGRFRPFDPEAGIQVRQYRYTWKLPDAQPNAVFPGGPPALQPFALEYQFDMKKGVVTECRVLRSEGVPLNPESLCSGMTGKRPQLPPDEAASARLTFRVSLGVERR